MQHVVSVFLANVFDNLYLSITVMFCFYQNVKILPVKYAFELLLEICNFTEP